VLQMCTDKLLNRMLSYTINDSVPRSAGLDVELSSRWIQSIVLTLVVGFAILGNPGK